MSLSNPSINKRGGFDRASFIFDCRGLPFALWSSIRGFQTQLCGYEVSPEMDRFKLAASVQVEDGACLKIKLVKRNMITCVVEEASLHEMKEH